MLNFTVVKYYKRASININTNRHKFIYRAINNTAKINKITTSLQALSLSIKNNKQVSTYLGIFFFICSGAMSSLLMVAIKSASYNTNMLPTHLLTWRYIFAFLALLPIMIKKRFNFLKPKIVRSNFARDIAATTATFMWYTFGINLPLGNLTLISFLTPVLIVVFAAIIFKEKISLGIVISLLFCLFGVAIVVKPDFITLGSSYIFILLTSVLRAVVGILSKNVLNKQSPLDALLSSVIFMTIFSCIANPPDIQYLTKDFAIEVTILSSLFFIYLMFYNIGVWLCDVGALQPFDFVRLCFSVGFGYYFFGDKINSNTLIGGTIIVLAGLYSVVSKQRRAKINNNAN